MGGVVVVLVVRGLRGLRSPLRGHLLLMLALLLLLLLLLLRQRGALGGPAEISYVFFAILSGFRCFYTTSYLSSFITNFIN